ncbi:transglycosylase associated protein [Tepidamorphus gemmatus]|uniref:Transglycosylase associated protein n=1 Tax=Tepidamorphus gemmatus TaxID=747076 RepID=A0A4R3MAP8_9HYPH|nr:transglycosylase associated protein [Tepidamorphus gemmatus]
MITIQSLIVLLIIGAIAGWLAGLIMQGRGFGLIGNIVVGVVGALIGGFVFGQLGIAMGGWIRDIIGATLGAVILLFIIGLVKKA